MAFKALLCTGFAAAAQAVSFTVQNEGGNATSPYAYGFMFEDINNSGDGGVYAELVQNRAFQGSDIFPSSLDYWHPMGGAAVSLQNLTNPVTYNLPTSMQVERSNVSGSTIGFYNDGFWGYPAVAAWDYKGTFWVEGDMTGCITVALKGNFSNTTYASVPVEVASTSGAWTQYNYTFKPTMDAPNSNNTLQFTFPASALNGPVNFNFLSLFPPTYNDRENGLRVDLMDAMADLKPSLFRAPGGNNVEGNRSPYWWNWTTTLGPVENRQSFPGAWGYENTNGLGLIEYMLWAQDIGMEPLLAIWSGMWLNADLVTPTHLGPYVQSALDELEFLTGGANTTWGAYRESLGYGPFEVNFVEVGNEDSLIGNGAESYRDYRFEMFYDAISTAYPNITIITSFYDVDPATGEPPHGATGDYHEYAVPLQMSSQFTRFDNYSDAHPLLIGEYAVVSYDIPGFDAPVWYTGAPRAHVPFWYGSVAEAIFLLGAERNSQKVLSAMYAPAFMNWNKWQWNPDLIQFDAYPGNTVLSTTYEVLKLLSNTRITENLPTTSNDFDPAYWVAGRSDKTGSHIVKAVVYNSTSAVPFHVDFEGVGAGAAGALTYLTAPMNSSNTVGNNVVQTVRQNVTASRSGKFSFELPEYSVAVFEVQGHQAGRGYGYSSPEKRAGWKGWKQWGKRSVKKSLNQWGQA